MNLSDVIYENKTLWFILAIVFIVLFALSTLVNIFLIFVRRRNLLELRDELEKQYQMQHSQRHVNYGGVQTTSL